MQKSRNAAAENEHALSRLQPRKPLAAHDTGKGLDKYALIERDVVGEDEDTAVDIQGGDAQVLAEPPRVVIGRVQCLAGRVAPLETVMAGIAGDVMGDENAVAGPVALNTGALFDDDPADLMAEDDGGLLDPVPLHDVAAADAAGHHLDEQLPRCDPGNGPFFDPDVMVVVVDGYFHGFNGSLASLSTLFRGKLHKARVSGFGARVSGMKKSVQYNNSQYLRTLHPIP